MPIDNVPNLVKNKIKSLIFGYKNVELENVEEIEERLQCLHLFDDMSSAFIYLNDFIIEDLIRKQLKNISTIQYKNETSLVLFYILNNIKINYKDFECDFNEFNNIIFIPSSIYYNLDFPTQLGQRHDMDRISLLLSRRSILINQEFQFCREVEKKDNELLTLEKKILQSLTKTSGGENMWYYIIRMYCVIGSNPYVFDLAAFKSWIKFRRILSSSRRIAIFNLELTRMCLHYIDVELRWRQGNDVSTKIEININELLSKTFHIDTLILQEYYNNNLGLSVLKTIATA